MPPLAPSARLGRSRSTPGKLHYHMYKCLSRLADVNNRWFSRLQIQRIVLKRAMITIEELEAIDDPLELFKLTSEAILQRQTDIDSLAAIRTRAAAALYAGGISYRDLAKLLDLSAPRLSNLVSGTEASVLEVMRAWAAVEQKISAFATSQGLESSDINYDVLRQILLRSSYFDPKTIVELDHLRAARNSIMHGRMDISEDEAAMLTDNAMHINARLVLALDGIDLAEVRELILQTNDASAVKREGAWASIKLRPGLKFGPWMLSRRLGKGRNGEVWETPGTDDRTYAIKIFNYHPSNDRLRRFKSEVKTLRKHRSNPGILPLLDISLDTGNGKPLWYMMPKAIPIRVALGNDPEPTQVVSAMAEIAGTLADLADEEIYHLNIKPSNLFRLAGKWVIGDFGLANYPLKDPVTQHGRLLAPVDYVPPELRRDADVALAGPADVWALAKTLWVLLTASSSPLPGTHRADDPAYMLQNRIRFCRAQELDWLLERATQIDPNDRLTMRQMEWELLASIATIPEGEPSEELEKLAARVAAFTDPHRREAVAAQGYRSEVQAAGNALNQLTQDVGMQLQRILDFDTHTDSGNAANKKLGVVDFPPHSWFSTGISLVPPGAQPAVKVLIATAMRIPRKGDPARVSGVLNVARLAIGLEDITEVWSATYEGVLIGSASQAHAFASIRAGLVSSFEPAVRKVAEILAET